MKYTPKYNLPYPEPADYVHQYPESTAEPFATAIDTLVDQVKWEQQAVSQPAANTYTEPGIYPIIASSQSQGLPVIANGVLTVMGHSNYLLQHYQSWKTGVLKSWVRRRTGSSPNYTWEPWQTIGWREDNILPGQDLNDFTNPGIYSCAATVANWPDGRAGTLEVLPYGTYVLQRFTTNQNIVYGRTLMSTGFTSWVRIATGDETDSLASRIAVLEQTTDTSDILPIRRGEHDMRVEAIRSRVGRVHAEGKAVVALVCDHGSSKFESIVLPKLRQHDMKATLAMCSTQLTLESGEVSDWSIVSDWQTNDKIEIACHSKTHKDVAGAGPLIEEIITARDDLAEHIGAPVDSWAQPGARNVITPGETYDGFMDGQGSSRYFTTAGELIWNGYGMATGGVTRPGSQAASHVYPITGTPPLGPARRFIDSDSTVAKNIVNHAISNGGRCIVSMHPNYIGQSGFQTQAEAEQFIDWLAARAAAGEIKIVQLREWAIVEN